MTQSCWKRPAQASGLSQKFLESVDEKPVDSSMLYRSVGFLTHGYEAIAAQALAAQREIIEAVAAEGPCVIVGRSADQVLAGHHKLFRVFITAGQESRIQRVMARDHLTQEETRQKAPKGGQRTRRLLQPADGNPLGGCDKLRSLPGYRLVWHRWRHPKPIVSTVRDQPKHET